MGHYCRHILDAIGNTPLVRLNRMVPEGAGAVLVKCENLNLGGSIKTRTALGIIRAAIADGRLQRDSILVEATSGNQGIAIAQIAAIMGYRAIIVMPENMSEERRKLIIGYGAEVVVTPVGETVTDTFTNCIRAAEALAQANPKVLLLKQFENPANPAVHYETTGVEIVEQAEVPIDAFVAAPGTGGSFSGIAKRLKETWPEVKAFAVEPAGAAILSGKPISNHRQQGIGDGFVPQNLDISLIDGIITVKDEDALQASRRLAREEGLMVGISSGSNVAAAIAVAQRLGIGSRVVTLLPDTAERYFTTELFK